MTKVVGPAMGWLLMHRLMIAAFVATAVPGSALATVRSGIVAWQQGDAAKAVAIWRMLADKGDKDAAFNLGQAYRLGRGVQADSGEAKKWFERAARTGHLDAQVSLGLLLFDVGDRAGALNWLQRAAERGEPRALLVTGTALFNGDGVARDPVRGYAYVSRAAAQGLAAARTTLADMDKVMSVDDRRKGVAMALAAVAAKPPATVTRPPSPKPVERAATKVVAPSRETKPPVTVASAGGWRIQLGAFGTRGSAQALFGKLASSLGGAQAYYIPVGAVTRLQAGPYASAAAAKQACARLSPRPCFPVAAR